ncbi:MAG TPA: aspartate carbamoyltransferase catalytic subunit, partial [Synergistaceae bacterium]|nr:aspartate carbamoyltransferase catalytic subunit [Synergistaceae bacterium]
MNATPSEIGQIVWRHRNVIDVDCFTREELYFLLDQARH